MTTFKEKEQLITFIMNKYHYTSLLKENSTYYLSSNNLDQLIGSALDNCEKETQQMLINEFLIKDNKNWWYEFYSRSSYYRIKAKAMDEFLRCINE